MSHLHQHAAQPSASRNPAQTDESVVDGMIELARCSRQHRILLAGARTPALMMALYRRGYSRLETLASCGAPRSQYDVALVDWRGRSVRALAATLDWLVHFLAPSAVLVVWIDSYEYEHPGAARLQSVLAKSGFQVEVGTRSPAGCGVAACRRDLAPKAAAA
jgi:hypothetical protein